VSYICIFGAMMPSLYEIAQPKWIACLTMSSS